MYKMNLYGWFFYMLLHMEVGLFKSYIECICCDKCWKWWSVADA